MIEISNNKKGTNKKNRLEIIEKKLFFIILFKIRKLNNNCKKKHKRTQMPKYWKSPIIKGLNILKNIANKGMLSVNMIEFEISKP